jgi:hypothetical protein
MTIPLGYEIGTGKRMTINDHLEEILDLAHHYCTGSSCERAINPQIASHFRGAVTQARAGESDTGKRMNLETGKVTGPGPRDAGHGK